MDNRELVARKISNADLLDVWIEQKSRYRGTDGATDLAAIHAVKMAIADAVLAALGDRLMPTWPDDWEIQSIKPVRGALFESAFVVRDGKAHPGLRTENWRFGTGPTIPAALADALKEHEGE